MTLHYHYQPDYSVILKGIWHMNSSITTLFSTPATYEFPVILAMWPQLLAIYTDMNAECYSSVVHNVIHHYLTMEHDFVIKMSWHWTH